MQGAQLQAAGGGTPERYRLLGATGWHAVDLG